MFVEMKLQEVTKAKEKAFGIFTKTLAKFEVAISKATQYLEENKAEIQKRQDANNTLEHHLASMQKSVSQIKTIIGE